MKTNLFFQPVRIPYYLLSRVLAESRNTQYVIRNRSGLTLVIFITFLLLSACGGQASAEPTPPTIHYGEDVCVFCGMIISEERYAAGYITREGEQRIFDDIGDMFQAQLAWQDEVVAYFVHDYESNRWARAETAHYVLSEALPTPMLSGLVACDSAEKAAALAAEVNGQVLTFSELQTRYEEGQVAAGHGHGMMHGH